VNLKAHEQFGKRVGEALLAQPFAYPFFGPDPLTMLISIVLVSINHTSRLI
jgi:hypothetical protein